MTPRFLPSPSLAPALAILVELGPEENLGPTPLGRRANYPITGGSFIGSHPDGEACNGRVLPGGADHFLLRGDEVGMMDASYRLQATDGTIINIRNRGLWVPDAAGRARLAAGEEPGPDELYCRCSPVFDAPAGPFAWLNSRVITGRVDYPAPDQVLIGCYRLL